MLNSDDNWGEKLLASLRGRLGVGPLGVLMATGGRGERSSRQLSRA